MSVLITGADGYIGGLLARRLLASGESVILLVRAADGVELARKRMRLAAALGAHDGRARVLPCDLAKAEALTAIAAESVQTIVHAAAITRFNVARDAARAANVAGTDHLLRFAERCPALESVLLLSTLYASGLAPGPLAETPIAVAPEFANHYEWSKWSAEDLLLRRYAHLPWSICRLATVIADHDSGTVTQRNAFHNSLRVYHHGLLSLAPGAPATPLYFITGAFAAEAILSVMANGPPRAVYHLSHRRSECITLGEMIAIAFDRFAETPDFRRKRILPPLFVDMESFRSLSAVASGLGGALVRQAASGMLPFAAQLYVAKDVANANLVAVHPGARAPDPRRLVAETCGHLLREHWSGEVRHAA
jgi:nucleoside-diphosphate-sugar epimerase